MHTSQIDLQLDYQVNAPAHFLFNIQAGQHEVNQRVEEELSISPATPTRHFCHERSGNRYFRLDAAPGLLSVRYQARLLLNPKPIPLHLDESPVTAVPDEVLRYLLPSRYCESDSLSRAAQQMFGQIDSGMARVRAVVSWIHDAITYLPGFSNSTTTAQQVFVQRAGVCRDFAHLGITLCRALNIPARLVVGYVHFAEPPEDFHAVFEAWLAGRWVIFDPTRMAPTDRLVRVGSGRDAKDVAFATIFGSVFMTRKALTVIEGDAPPASATGLQALAEGSGVAIDSGAVCARPG